VVLAAPGKLFVGTARNTSRPYKTICRDGLGTASTNHSMICRHGCLGAAWETAPTNPYEPPLQTIIVVVTAPTNLYENDIYNKRNHIL
jgi:hypothetical protein